jgi:hypothetical protein
MRYNILHRYPLTRFNQISDVVGSSPVAYGKTTDIVGSSPVAYGETTDIVGFSPVAYGKTTDTVGSSPVAYGETTDVVGRLAVSCGGTETGCCNSLTSVTIPGGYKNGRFRIEKPAGRYAR